VRAEALRVVAKLWPDCWAQCAKTACWTPAKLRDGPSGGMRNAHKKRGGEERERERERQREREIDREIDKDR
jgi:hypothetical protein